MPVGSLDGRRTRSPRQIRDPVEQGQVSVSAGIHVDFVQPVQAAVGDEHAVLDRNHVEGIRVADVTRIRRQRLAHVVRKVRHQFDLEPVATRVAQRHPATACERELVLRAQRNLCVLFSVAAPHEWQND
jgi:hypothetical protein